MSNILSRLKVYDMKLHYPHWFKATLIIALFALGGLAAATLQPLFRRIPIRRVNLLVPWIQTVWLRAVCRVLGVRLSIRGTPMHGNGLWVSNHVSWLDVVVLGALQPTAFLAKSEVASWPLVGFLGRQSGNLFINRGNSGSDILETMTKRLQCGDRLVMFPEGTTTRGDTVRHFHGRLLQPAISAGVPLQTVAIEYQGAAVEKVPFVDDDEFLPNLLGLLHLPSICVTLHFGEPLLITEGVQRNALARRARSQVLTALGLEIELAQAA
jgi:1-acyl-sn-glycerol-3-phosphate acyltransferase